MRFVDVTNDIAFRKIFGNQNKKKALISFLNAVISLPENDIIVDVEILNPYQLSKLSGGKSTIVDVKAKDKQGNTFIVEMQISEFDFFHKRILYYTSQSYISQIDSGTQYDKLKPVYFIGILQFNISSNKNYHSRHKVLDVETNEHIIQDVEFNFIELLKFNKSLTELQTNIDQWTYFIKNAENLQVIPENISDEGLKEAYLEADRQNWTKQELEDYERSEIKERDDIGKLELAEKRGIEKGKKEGIVEGIQVGFFEGKVQIARLMKENGEPSEKISLFTGLTKNEIEHL